jgi:antitoxin HicB
MRRYTVVLIPDLIGGGYTAQVPALPECFTEGQTVAETFALARDVIQLTLESRAAHGESLPEEQAAVVVQVATVDVDDPVHAAPEVGARAHG